MNSRKSARMGLPKTAKAAAAVLAIWAGMSAISAAHAECPAAGLQNAVAIFAAADQAGADLDAIAKQIDAVAQACASNPNVQKVAAMTYQVLTARAASAAKAYNYAVSAWARYNAMRRVRGPNEKPVMVMIGGRVAEINVYGYENFSQPLLMNLFITEIKSDKPYPEHQPLKRGEKLRACGEEDFIDAQDASLIVRSNLKSEIPPALNMLDRLSAICAGVFDKGLYQRIPALRAAALYQLVADNPNRPDADAMLAKAVADSKRFFEINPKGDTVYWSTYDRDRLDEFVNHRRLASMPLPPEADWFKPGNPESAAVVRAIAAKLDDAWAIDEPLGIGGAYKTYRALLGGFYDKAMKSGNVMPARHAIALAAQGHSNGSLRRAETKSLKAPPDFLWNWVEPALKPAP